MTKNEFTQLFMDVIDKKIKPTGRKDLKHLTHQPINVKIDDDYWVHINKNAIAAYDPILDQISIRPNANFKANKLLHELAHKSRYDIELLRDPIEFDPIAIHRAAHDGVESATEEVIADLVSIALCLKMGIRFGIRSHRNRIAAYATLLSAKASDEQLDDILEKITEDCSSRYRFINEHYGVGVK